MSVTVTVVPTSERKQNVRKPQGPWKLAFRQIKAGKTVRISGITTPAYIYDRAKKYGVPVHVSKRPRSFVVWMAVSE